MGRIQGFSGFSPLQVSGHDFQSCRQMLKTIGLQALRHFSAPFAES